MLRSRAMEKRNCSEFRKQVRAGAAVARGRCLCGRQLGMWGRHGAGKHGGTDAALARGQPGSWEQYGASEHVLSAAVRLASAPGRPLPAVRGG